MTVYRIYQIVSDQGPSCYIGSTLQTPTRRFNDHITAYRRGAKTCSIRTMFDLYGVESCHIIILEEVECETEEEARRRERHYQDDHKEHCVNTRRAYITREELTTLNNVRARRYMKTYYTRKQETLAPEEFQAFMKRKRQKAVEAQTRYRQRQAEAKRLLSLLPTQ